MFPAVLSRVLQPGPFPASIRRLAGALVFAGVLSGLSGPAWSQTKQANTLPAFAFPRDDMRERAARENWTAKPVPVPQAQSPYLGGILQRTSWPDDLWRGPAPRTQRSTSPQRNSWVPNR